MIYFLQISNITAFQRVLLYVSMKGKHMKCALYRLFSKLIRKQPFILKLWILNMGLLRKLERKALERLKTFTKLYEIYMCVCVHFIYIFMLHKYIFFLAYIFVTKLYTTSLCKQRAKSSLWTNSDKQHSHPEEAVWAGDLISEESTVLSQTALPVQPVGLNEMNLLDSAQCFREGGVKGIT